MSSTQSGNRLKLSRTRVLSCDVPLEAGTSTLRVKLAPLANRGLGSPVRVELFVMR